MAAILVMRPKHYEQTFVPLPHEGSMCNFVSIGPVVSEEMTFENVDANVNIDADANNGQRTQKLMMDNGQRNSAHPTSSLEAFCFGELTNSGADALLMSIHSMFCNVVLLMSTHVFMK